MAARKPLVTLFVACLVALALPAAAAKAPGTAPSLTLRTRSGAVALDSLRGKVVIVDFWASWCGPCHQSFPWLESLRVRYAAQGLQVIAVDVDKNSDDADEFLAKHKVGFGIAYDPAGKAAEAFGVEGMPSTFLIGRDGRVLVRHVGFGARKTAPFETALQEALKP